MTKTIKVSIILVMIFSLSLLFIGCGEKKPSLGEALDKISDDIDKGLEEVSKELDDAIKNTEDQDIEDEDIEDSDSESVDVNDIWNGIMDGIEEDEDGEIPENIGDYDSIKEVSIPSDYRKDIVPIYTNSKVYVAVTEKGTNSALIELILPEGEYDKAVAFYTSKLDAKPQSADLGIMKSTTYTGKVGEVNYVVLVGLVTTGGPNPIVTITMY